MSDRTNSEFVECLLTVLQSDPKWRYQFCFGFSGELCSWIIHWQLMSSIEAIFYDPLGVYIKNKAACMFCEQVTPYNMRNRIYGPEIYSCILIFCLYLYVLNMFMSMILNERLNWIIFVEQSSFWMEFQLFFGFEVPFVLTLTSTDSSITAEYSGFKSWIHLWLRYTMYNTAIQDEHSSLFKWIISISHFSKREIE